MPSETWSKITPNLQLAWDATSLRSFATCPRRYYYEMIRGKTRGGDGVDVTFGFLYHGALEEFDKGILAGVPLDELRISVLMWALDHSGERVEFVTPDGEPDVAFLPWQGVGPKTRWGLIRALVWYMDDYEKQGANGVRPYAFPDGTPAVELSFRVPLGLRTSHPTDPEQYILCGHLDGLCEAQGQFFVRERKTTKNALGPYYFDNYGPDPQVDTYDLAAHIMFPELAVAGVVVEATQVGVQFARFQRQPLYRTPAQRDEWLDEIAMTIGEAEECALNDFWPRRTAVCGLYGGCPFRKVCNKSPAVRERFLTGGDYADRRWDPMETR